MTFTETIIRGLQGQSTDDLRPGDRIEIVAKMDASESLGNVQSVSGPVKIGGRCSVLNLMWSQVRTVTALSRCDGGPTVRDLPSTL